MLGFAHDAIRHLIAHRLKREDKVFGAMRALKSATIQELLPKVYDDVDAALYPVAARSLLAHLEKLADDGKVSHAAERWTLA